MDMETINQVLTFSIIVCIFPMLYIYNEIILPTNKKYGGDKEVRFLPSDQIKQVTYFLKICNENNIHYKAVLFTKLVLIGLPILIVALVIIMGFKVLK